MKTDTKSRHRTPAGDNVFVDLGFAPKEAKRLLSHADAKYWKKLPLNCATLTRRFYLLLLTC